MLASTQLPVGPALGRPRARRVARRRPVRVLAAPEAEHGPAPARHLVGTGPRPGPNGEGAPGPRAPPDVLARALLHVRPDHEHRVPRAVGAGGRRVDQLPHDGRRAPRVRAPQQQAPRAVAHRRADVAAPALVAVVVRAPRRPHLAGGVAVEADAAVERPVVERRGDGAAPRRQADGAADAPIVGEPLVLELLGVPPAVPQERGGEAPRDRQQLRHPRRDLVLAPAHVVLGLEIVALAALLVLVIVGFHGLLVAVVITDAAAVASAVLALAVLLCAVVALVVVVIGVAIAILLIALRCHGGAAACQDQEPVRED